MDAQALKSFICIAERASFTLAAEQLHITQPAISKRIAGLEAELNTRLFDRIGREVRLTESGISLLPHAQRIIREIEDSKREIQDLSRSVAGHLKLAISHHIGLHRLPPVLKAFSQQYPAVKLDISFTDSETAHDDIAHGRQELAVVTLAPQHTLPHSAQWKELHKRLYSATIWRDPLVVVVAADHELANEAAVDLARLAALPAILPDRTTYTGQLIEELFRQRELSLQIFMATNYLETIKMMVSIGLGWSVLPLTMLDDSLTRLQCDDLQIARELGYVRHRQRRLSNAATAMIKLLEQYHS